MGEDRDRGAEARLESTASDFSTAIGAALLAGASVTISMSIFPRGSDGDDLAPGPEREPVDDKFAAVRATAHATNLGGQGAIKELFGLGQRVGVPHLEVEGVITGITDWLEDEPSFHVRWNDQKCAARGGWFERGEIQSLPDHIRR